MNRMIIILLLHECVEFICFRRVLKFSIRLFKGTDGQSKVGLRININFGFPSYSFNLNLTCFLSQRLGSSFYDC